jgi:hypothetical protein
MFFLCLFPICIYGVLYFDLCIVPHFVCNCLFTIFVLVYWQCHQMDTHLQQVKITSFRFPGVLLPSWPRWPPVETLRFQSPVYLPNFPVNEPPSTFPNVAAMEMLRFQSQWIIHSFVSQSPQLRSSSTEQGENIWTPSTEPQADGWPTFNGVRHGSPSRSFMTLLLLLQYHAAFSTIPSDDLWYLPLWLGQTKGPLPSLRHSNLLQVSPTYLLPPRTWPRIRIST